MVDERDIIDDILDNFDFDKVHNTMELLEWRWHGTGIPSVSDLRKRARSLLKDCLKHDEYSVSTGGLHASKKTFDGVPFYRLMFVVTTWDNYE